MKKFFICFYFLLGTISLLFSNRTLLSDTINIPPHPYSGKKSVLIRVDPLMDFVGNLFNGSSYNQIRLNTAGLVYRRYLTDNKVKRLTLNANFSSNIYDGQLNSFGVLDDGYRKDDDFRVGISLGKEKHIVQNKFSLYYGHEFLFSAFYRSLNNIYDYNNGDIINEDVFSSTFRRRETLESRNFGASIGFAGLFGVDYMLSKRFFLNAELKIPLVLTYNLRQSTRYEDVLVDFESRQLTVIPLTNRPDLHLFTFNLSSTQFFQFRVGFVF